MPTATSQGVTAEVAQQFAQLVTAHINAEPYHAALLLSGGKDSAYILHRMQQAFPDLRMLCVCVNNGFMSPVALKNVTHVAEKLGVDLLVVNSCKQRFARVLRQAFLDLKGRGSYGVVDKADGDLIFEIGRQVALDRKIPLMLGGLSWVQLEKIFGTKDFTLAQQEGVLSIFLLAVWRTNEQEIRSIVRTLKLLLPGSDSPIVSNNALITATSVIDVLNRGYCSFEPEFAQLVREGKTDRKTWLHTFELLEFATRKGFLARDVNTALGKLGLTLADVVGVQT
jgi:hypothetical protein